jgi:hypothetical protein
MFKNPVCTFRSDDKAVVAIEYARLAVRSVTPSIVPPAGVKL